MYLHSKLQLRLIHLQSRLSSTFGVLPFTWDVQQRKYQTCSKTFNYSIYTTIPLCTCQFIFVLQEVFRHIFLSQSKQLTGSLFCSLVVLLLLTLQHVEILLLYTSCDEFVTLLNTFKAYTNHIAENYMKSNDDSTTKKITRIWDQSTIYNLCVVVCACIVASIHFCAFPHDPCYVTQYLQSYLLPQFIKVILYSTYLIYFQWGFLKIQLVFCFINNFAFEILVQHLTLLQNEFRIGKCKNVYQTISKFRTLPTLIYEYRACELVQKMLLDLLGILIAFGYAIGLVITIACNSILVKRWDHLVATQKLALFTVTILFQVLWIVLLQGTKIALVCSMKNISSWKWCQFAKRKDRSYMAAFRRSCRPVQIGYKNYIRFGRQCVLNFLWTVYRLTFRVNALLTSFGFYK